MINEYYPQNSFEKLIKVLPHEYQSITWDIDKSKLFDTLIFSTNKIMISSKVIMAIEELTKRVENNLVVFGHCFTEEGRAYRKENRIVFLNRISFIGPMKDILKSIIITDRSIETLILDLEELNDFSRKL
ncbi:MAG: hypothetical protein PHP32_00600 [Candidatus Izemoplasmatales bacterium]|nr:hypothetical protein [Candidatus Izemoplasmatales bacterium]